MACAEVTCESPEPAAGLVGQANPRAMILIQLLDLHTGCWAGPCTGVTDVTDMSVEKSPHEIFREKLSTDASVTPVASVARLQTHRNPDSYRAATASRIPPQL